VESDVIVGIDIGDHKVCALVGEGTPEGNVNIIGVGVAPTNGMKRGMVVSVDDVAASVSAAVEKAERVSGYQIRRAQVSITGNHIVSVNSRGVVAVVRSNHEITDDDVERAMESARAIPNPSNREVIHVIPRFFVIDGQEGVPNPVGMFGFRLEGEAHIVTAATTWLQNVQRCLTAANIEARAMVAAPLAAAEAVITPQEKDMGVVVADIGGGTTGICIYVDGSPWHTTVLPVGGMHVTNDLAVGLRLPFAAAEELKIRYGHALATSVDSKEMIPVPGAVRDDRPVSRRRECEIIEDRVTEIYAMILNEIKKSGHEESLLPGGVVLTGGAAELPGMVELGQDILGLPVRVGVPQRIGGLVDSISSPTYAASVGLLHWGLKYRDEGSEEGGPHIFDEGIGDMARKFSDFLRRAFGFGR